MAEAPAKKKAAPSSGGIMSKKVGGVPLPIIIVGGLVAAIVIYRKIKGSSSSSTTAAAATPAATDTSGTDTGTSDGSGGGWSGGGGSTGAGGNGTYGQGTNTGSSSLAAQIAALATALGSLSPGGTVSPPAKAPVSVGLKPAPVSAKASSQAGFFTAAQAAKTQTIAPQAAGKATGQAGVAPTVKQTTTGTTPAKAKVGTGVQGSGLKNSGL